jgi:P22 coat protein - gene protein 5
MTIPNNVLVNVPTYQEGALALMTNENAFVGTANARFKNFQDEIAQLGQTVTFDLPPRGIATGSLVANFQGMTQRVQSLTVNTPASFSFAFNNEQFVYNVKDYMEKFGKAAIAELGAIVEADVANVCVNNTYRFYGDGVTAINSYSQLATALAYFRNYSAISSDTRGYIPDLAVPGIINSGLSQFVTKRNEETANSWELGSFSRTEWYQSNLLPIHVAGLVGNGASAAVQTLTVVSTNDPTGTAISQITCTCDASLSGATGVIKNGDVAVFKDGVAGLPNMRYLTFVGHKQSANPVQIRMTADADASGTTVVLSIAPTLCAVPSGAQNIANNIVAGMKIIVMPSHRAGMINSGNTLFLAMPRLPDQSPFVTANKADPETGISIRMTHGATFGQNTLGTVFDTIYGYTQVEENAMRILFPL